VFYVLLNFGSGFMFKSRVWKGIEEVAEALRLMLRPEAAWWPRQMAKGK